MRPMLLGVIFDGLSLFCVQCLAVVSHRHCPERGAVCVEGVEKAYRGRRTS